MPLLKNLQVFNALKVPWKVTSSFSPGKKSSVVPRFAKLNKRSPKIPPPPPPLSILITLPAFSPHPNVLEIEKLPEGLTRVIRLLSRISDDPRKKRNGSVMINNVMACAVTDIT